MRTYLHEGDKLTLTAPSGGVTAGVGYVIGANTFVVAEGTAAAGAKFVGIHTGVVRLLKSTSDAATEGADAYWDNTAKLVRAASATGRFLIGRFEAAQGASDTTADVILNANRVVVI